MAEAKKGQREQRKRGVKRAIDAIGTEAFNTWDFYDIKSRLDRLEDNFKSFETATDELLAIAGGDPDRANWIVEADELEEEFVSAKARYTARFVELTPEVVTNMAAQPAGAVGGQAATGPPAQNVVVQVAPQPGAIPDTWGKFSGNLLDWFEFKDRFEAAVHKVDIPIINKFTYLQKALTGPAAEMLGRWGIKENNYEDGWKRLTDKFSKRYPLACVYLGKFFALSKPKDRLATAEELQHMANITMTTLHQLRAMDYRTENWDLIFVHALQERLDEMRAGKWEEERDENEQPTIEEMVKFLEKQATKAQNQGLSYPSQHSATAQDQASAVQRPTGTIPRTNNRAPAGEQWYDRPCAVCDSHGHQVYVCPEFKPLPLAHREAIAKANHLCFNCLQKNHSKRDCRDPHRCMLKECQNDNRHNSMLCPQKNKAWYATSVGQGARAPSSSSGFSDGTSRSRSSVFKRLGEPDHS